MPKSVTNTLSSSSLPFCSFLVPLSSSSSLADLTSLTQKPKTLQKTKRKTLKFKQSQSPSWCSSLTPEQWWLWYHPALPWYLCSSITVSLLANLQTTWVLVKTMLVSSPTITFLQVTSLLLVLSCTPCHHHWSVLYSKASQEDTSLKLPSFSHQLHSSCSAHQRCSVSQSKSYFP